MAETLPPGWWNLSNLSGTRGGVVKAVADSKIPENWKLAIAADIAALDPKFNMVKLDAHCHTEKGVTSFHLSITPSTGLTG
jgi:hypothetical protein